MKFKCIKTFYYSGSEDTLRRWYEEGEEYELNEVTQKHLTEIDCIKCFQSLNPKKEKKTGNSSKTEEKEVKKVTEPLEEPVKEEELINSNAPETDNSAKTEESEEK